MDSTTLEFERYDLDCMRAIVRGLRAGQIRGTDSGEAALAALDVMLPEDDMLVLEFDPWGHAVWCDAGASG